MQELKPKILLISSADPCIGAGVIVSNTFEAFLNQGYTIDVLTLYKCSAKPEFLFVYDKDSFSFKIKWFLRKAKTRIGWYVWSVCHSCRHKPKPGFHFFYRKEENPPIPVKDVLSKINKNYDLVFISFWQGMLSFYTVQRIYEKLHCKFRFGFVDYSPMAGGCHFTGDCERYQVGCGCCPAFNSKDPNDFTHQNILFRKRVYDRIKPVITGNSYMFTFYDKSFLLKDVQRDRTFPVIDTNKFKPLDKTVCRNKYGISEDIQFIILFGAQQIDNVRKGVEYLIEALHKFYERLNDIEKSRILVVAIGENFSKIQDNIKFKSKGLGFISFEDLPSVYSMADVFLCSSINDAGPMMVNQALCCGIPVVGFRMGACLDVIKDGITGYCVQLLDTDAYSNRIYQIWNRTEAEVAKMKENCIKHALITYSQEAMVDRVIKAFNKYKNSSSI